MTSDSDRDRQGRRPLRRLARSGAAWLSPRLWLRRVVFWGGAILVGVVAVVFAISAEAAQALFKFTVEQREWAAFVVLPLGLMLVVWWTRRLFPGTQGSGIPQTIAALQLSDHADRDRLLSVRIALGKVMLTVLGLASGASVGREGPSVQIGASIMYALGRRAHFPRYDVARGLILAGGAAGMAAAFNTPLAGVVFALEELSRSFEQRTNGIIISAVIIAGVTSLALLGNYTYFGRSAAVLALDQSWLAVLTCGVAGGLLGGLFSRALIWSSRGLPGPLGRLSHSRPYSFAFLCGLALALIGFASGGTTYGTGYHEAKQLIEATGEVNTLFAPLKLLATFISYLSGIPGGVFAPSLAVGAGIGASIAPLLPAAGAEAIVMLGMVAFFAGVVQAPITAFIVVMEMTDNHGLVIPLMTAALLASGAARAVCRERLYQALAIGFLESRHATAPTDDHAGMHK